MQSLTIKRSMPWNWTDKCVRIRLIVWMEHSAISCHHNWKSKPNKPAGLRASVLGIAQCNELAFNISSHSAPLKSLMYVHTSRIHLWCDHLSNYTVFDFEWRLDPWVQSSQQLSTDTRAHAHTHRSIRAISKSKPFGNTLPLKWNKMKCGTPTRGQAHIHRANWNHHLDRVFGTFSLNAYCGERASFITLCLFYSIRIN